MHIKKSKRRLRRHHIYRIRRHNFRILNDWDRAVHLTHHFATCPVGCYMCRNPRRTGSGLAALTLAERKIRDGHSAQLEELRLRC